MVKVAIPAVQPLIIQAHKVFLIKAQMIQRIPTHNPIDPPASVLTAGLLPQILWRTPNGTPRYAISLCAVLSAFVWAFIYGVGGSSWFVINYAEQLAGLVTYIGALIR